MPADISGRLYVPLLMRRTVSDCFIWFGCCCPYGLVVVYVSHAFIISATNSLSIEYSNKL